MGRQGKDTANFCAIKEHGMKRSNSSHHLATVALENINAT